MVPQLSQNAASPPACVVPNRLPPESKTGFAHGPVPSGPPPVKSYSTFRFHVPPDGDSSYTDPWPDNPPENSVPYRLPDASRVRPPSSSPPSSNVKSCRMVKLHLLRPKGLSSNTTPKWPSPPWAMVVP